MIAAFYLLAAVGAATPTPPECESKAADQVVVCATRRGESPYRLPKLPDKYAPKKIRAEAQLAPGVGAAARVSSSTMPDGRKSDRLMLTIGVGF